MQQPLSTKNTMEKRSPFAARAVGKRFCPRPPVLNRKKSPEAAVGIKAENESVISTDIKEATLCSLP
jgi:hypothetical protein